MMSDCPRCWDTPCHCSPDTLRRVELEPLERRLTALEQDRDRYRDLLMRIRRESALCKRGGAGGQDQYAGMPPCYRLIDHELRLEWTG